MNLITNIPKERFNKFVEAHLKNHFEQSYEWGTFKSSLAEWDFETVGLENASGHLVAAALVLIRNLPMIKRPILYIPRGFVIDFDDRALLKTFVEAFKRYAKNKKAIFFKMDPDIKYVDRDVDGQMHDETTKNDALIMDLQKLGFKHLGFTKDFDSTIQPRYTFRLELVADECDLLKGCHPKTRYNIKVAQKKGIEIIEATRDELPIFEKIMKVTGQRDGFLIRPLSYFENMYDQLNPSGMCKLYLAKLNTKQALHHITQASRHAQDLIRQYEAALMSDGLTEKRKKKITNQLAQEKNKSHKLTARLTEMKKMFNKYPEGMIMSGIITTHFGNKSWYLYGASDHAYREFMPNYLIQWHALTEAKQAGYDMYDFFGISGIPDAADPLYGLYRFKKGFGGEFTEFIGEFDYVMNPVLYWAWITVLRVFKKYKHKLIEKTKG